MKKNSSMQSLLSKTGEVQLPLVEKSKMEMSLKAAIEISVNQGDDLKFAVLQILQIFPNCTSLKSPNPPLTMVYGYKY